MMIDDVYAVLTADAILTGLLVGGIYHQRTAPEISRQYTPAAFDGDRNIRPCCLLRIADTLSIQTGLSIVTNTIEIFYYEKWNYSTIEQARARVRCLIDKKYILSTSVDKIELNYLSGYTEDSALICRLLIDRYTWQEPPCEGC